MAEASGLVLGTVALVSLFGTCLDLFDRIQSGRCLVGSYLLACDKVDLLKTRLERWAEPIRICEAAHNNPASDSTPLSMRYIIARNLANIKEVLDKASALKGKYQIVVRSGSSSTKGTWLRHRSTVSYARQDQPYTTDTTNVKGSVGFRKRTLWALHDKQKFDNLIQDLSFFIDNLEKAADSVMPSTKKETGLGEHVAKDLANKATKQTDPNAIPRKSTAERSSDQTEPVGSQKQRNGPEQIRVYHKFDREYTGNQENDNSLGVAGDILSNDSTAKTEHVRTRYNVNQKNTRNAVGVMGNACVDVVTAYESSCTR